MLKFINFFNMLFFSHNNLLYIQYIYIYIYISEVALTENFPEFACCNLLDGRRTTCKVHSSTENRIDWDLRIDIGSKNENLLKSKKSISFNPALANFVVFSGLHCHCGDHCVILHMKSDAQSLFICSLHK